MRRRIIAALTTAAVIVGTWAAPAAAEDPDPDVLITRCEDIYFINTGGSVLVLVEDTPDAIASGLSTRTSGVLVVFDADGDGTHERYVARQGCPVVVVPKPYRPNQPPPHDPDRLQPYAFDWDDVSSVVDITPDDQREYDAYYDKVRSEWNNAISDCDAHTEGTQPGCHIAARNASNTIRVGPFDGVVHTVECEPGERAVRHHLSPTDPRNQPGEPGYGYDRCDASD